VTRRLTRSSDGRPAAPVRIVHLGVGNFFRAHQAWYTEHASDADAWGIAAFTGRSATVAEQLEPAEGLYTLVTQAPAGNVFEVISSLSAVHPAADLPAWRGYFADPAVGIVTSTITEAGYLRAGHGADLADPALAAAIEALKADPAAAVSTAPAKFVAGLLARRAADAGPLTFVPCDNVPENGAMVRAVVESVAALVDRSLLDWMAGNVSYVTTMVDRITPRVTPETITEIAEKTGIDDPAAVVTEPFHEWVLSGEFAAGRPDWDATFVDEIAPFETRKLWLLNGSHTLMAYTAPILGLDTVRDGIEDETVHGWVEQWWDEAAAHLEVPAEDVVAYRAALLERYRNPQIRHLLAQIAADGSQKLAIRIVPVLNAEVAAGRTPAGACRAIAGWVQHLRGHGAPVTDSRADEVRPLVDGSLEDAVANVCSWLGVEDEAARDLILDQARELGQ